MIAQLLHRPELERLAGGWWIVRALDALVSAINTPPVYLGTTKISTGDGAPNNKVAGSIGDLYLRTDGSTSTVLYVKESGSNTTTGWVAK